MPWDGKLLPGHCQVDAKVSPTYNQVIIKIFPSYFQVIPKLFPVFPQVSQLQTSYPQVVFVKDKDCVHFFGQIYKYATARRLSILLQVLNYFSTQNLSIP